jgi:hypothetical protein
MCTLDDAADVNPVINFLRHALQRVKKKTQHVAGINAYEVQIVTQ